MKKDKLLFLFILFLMLFSCRENCLDEVCQCTPIEIILEYNFNPSSSISFPVTQIDNFEVFIVNNSMEDTVNYSNLSNWKYETGYNRKVSIFIYGELSPSEYNDYKNFTYYVVNQDLNYVDSLTNIDFNYSVIDCEKQQNLNFCGSADCMEFESSSFRFMFNGKMYGLDDLPIILNYE